MTLQRSVFRVGYTAGALCGFWAHGTLVRRWPTVSVTVWFGSAMNAHMIVNFYLLFPSQETGWGIAVLWSQCRVPRCDHETAVRSFSQRRGLSVIHKFRGRGHSQVKESAITPEVASDLTIDRDTAENNLYLTPLPLVSGVRDHSQVNSVANYLSFVSSREV